MTISQSGEFGLIERITARLGTGPTVLLGPGDDAAVVAATDGRVVASTDVLVEGRHFRTDWASATDVGHRAAAANLADIAAMGATPTALLVALCAPHDMQVSWAEELADGLAAEAAIAGASVVGGDISSSPTLTIAVTALGDLRGVVAGPAGRRARRRRAGDCRPARVRRGRPDHPGPRIPVAEGDRGRLPPPDRAVPLRPGRRADGRDLDDRRLRRPASGSRARGHRQRRAPGHVAASCSRSARR